MAQAGRGGAGIALEIAHGKGLLKMKHPMGTMEDLILFGCPTLEPKSLATIVHQVPRRDPSAAFSHSDR